MWKLWHFLFGCDYVVMEAHHAGLFGSKWKTTPICRVQKDAAGREFVVYRDRIVFLPPYVEYLTK